MVLISDAPAGAWNSFIPDLRWFAPPANIQHPSGIGFRGDEIVTALYLRTDKDQTRTTPIATNCWRGELV